MLRQQSFEEEPEAPRQTLGELLDLYDQLHDRDRASQDAELISRSPNDDQRSLIMHALSLDADRAQPLHALGHERVGV